jgi:hypothetical protein
MPIPLDPSETFDLTLDFDKGTPEDKRPSFTCRYQSYRERAAYKRVIEAAADVADKEQDHEKAIATAMPVLRKVIVGWKNIDRPFDVEALPDVLTGSEFWELAWAIPSESALSEHEKKTSRSRSRTAAAPSAEPAATGSATTNQASTEKGTAHSS